MVYSGIFCTVEEVQDKVGEGGNVTYNVETFINRAVTQAESQINVEAEFNYSDTGVFAALPAGTKNILTIAAASWAAIKVMEADLTGWSARERETKLDVLNNDYEKAIAKLKDKEDVKTFIQTGEV